MILYAGAWRSISMSLLLVSVTRLLIIAAFGLILKTGSGPDIPGVGLFFLCSGAGLETTGSSSVKLTTLSLKT
ncbi:hypothetical protein [Paenibacillus tyrfis]|uniref:hypothetical protein n=1 Tax=Paenibacillus tyrfis TaxID=1501230 RepID=UPI00209F6ED0|nr:hypothetical protein [Paenibacillus tyrfis]MCP1310158.1 hypothetical protein [Paenibacillus tyrfis]